MPRRGRVNWRWIAAAVLSAALVLGLAVVLRVAGLGAAANVAQLVSLLTLLPLVAGFVNRPSARSSERITKDAQLAGLSEKLRDLADGKGLTGKEIRARLHGWDGAEIDAYLNGTLCPSWDFVGLRT
jgi:hypothetical protein